MSDKSDKEFLKALARDVLDTLSQRRYGTPIRLYQKPSRLYNSHTEGWLVEIGQLRPGKCYLQIWLDRFTLYSDRKICCCFSYAGREPVEYLYKGARGSIGQEPKRLGDEGLQFQTRVDSLLNQQLRQVERIAEFFETIARSLPDATPSSMETTTCLKEENRKRQHFQRERNGYLATLRKQKDGYKCQICGMRFEDVYGAIGRDFAEAHHIVPLSKSKGTTFTRIDDLITVCSNCHRMLDRLDGEQGDIQELKKMMKQQQLKVRAKRNV